jgi:hypothetical protein
VTAGRWREAGLGAMLVAAAGVVAAARLRSYDLFWHLAAGRLMAQQGVVPRSEPFSFTAAGVPWVDHEWLFQVLVWRLWNWVGTWGPWSMKLVLAGGIAWVLFRFLRRRGVAPVVAVLLVLVVLRGAAFRFTARPEMFTLLGAALAAHLLCWLPGREQGRRALLPLLLVPLAALWANLHPGAILAPLLVAAILGGELAAWALGCSPWSNPRRRVRILGITLPLTAGALLINPYGAHLLAIPFRLTGIVGQPWAPNPEWSRPEIVVFPLLYLAAAALVVAALARPGRVDLASLTVGLLGAALALRYVRNIGVFFVLLPFALAPLVMPAAPGSRGVGGWIRPAAVAAAGLIGLMVVVPAGIDGLGPGAGTRGPGLEPGRYPVEASDFLDSEELDGALFNEVAFGGYLIWRFPGRPVFIDGRNEVYPDLLQEIHEGLGDLPAFWELTERWGIETALLRYPPSRPLVAYPAADGTRRMVERAWSEVYFPRHRWALVHWDDTALVKVRRDAVDPLWLEAREYVHLNPDDWPFLLDEVRSGRVDGQELLGELGRKLAEDPGCRRAREMEAAVRALTGEVG